MASPIKRALVAMGYRVREYSPVGELLPGMSYLVRRLLENTSNEGLLRAKFSENVSEQQLLRDPTELVRENGEREHPAGAVASGKMPEAARWKRAIPGDGAFSDLSSGDTYENAPLVNF